MARKAILKETIPSPSVSASAADSAGTYEVYLSFRGKDTRYGFTDYLYRDLVDARVRTFRDDDELRVGEEIGPELVKAIKDSKISIPIFSKKYAESKWCLREFALMVECRAKQGQKIYPIFYDVEPSEVQHYERGSYSEAFVKQANNPDVQQWKNALAIVGELKGWELKKAANGHEGALVKIVVQKVLSELKKDNMHLPRTLVGIDNHIKQLEGLLDSESNGVRIIGILGMSGLGKTTISKAIYNELIESFESHCFLEEIRGESQRQDGVLNLQKQLLPKILKREILKIHNVDEGADMIKRAIRGKRVLLVLDNVDDKFQIEKLAVNHKWYAAGSRIIITTTNEEVLLAIKESCEEEGKGNIYRSYKPKLMGNKDALKLFSMCAFKRESPPEGYLELAKEAVANAGGLPLVLETLGSSLCIEKDKVSWEEKLKQLKEIPPQKVLDRLRISYDALDFGQKQIFLDIACFFAGRNPIYVWDGCNFGTSDGINALVRRSLITVTEDNIIRMHDQLREFGKQIVKENLAHPWERSRLCDHSEALEMLQKHQGLKNVEALRLDFPEPEGFYLYGATTLTYRRVQGQDFVKLPKLRYLSVNFADLCGDFNGLHSKLRWLEWRGCSGNVMPFNLYLRNLVILDLSYSKITDDWRWWDQIKMATKLKGLNLSSCYYLARVPDLSNLTSLESLQLNYCKSLSTIDGLEQLVSLIYLSMSECYALERLPDLSKLGKLRMLQIRGCRKLTAIHGLHKLESLELLDMSGCSYLESLPNFSNL